MGYFEDSRKNVLDSLVSKRTITKESWSTAVMGSSMWLSSQWLPEVRVHLNW